LYEAIRVCLLRGWNGIGSKKARVRVQSIFVGVIGLWVAIGGIF